MSFSTGNSSQSAEINVTPLIDVLLVLLIIFMIIVPMKPNGLSALLPQPPLKNTPTIPTPTTVVLQVHAGVDGGAPSYSINEQPVTKADMVAKLEGIYVNRSEKVMFVKGDPDLEFNAIAEVVGLAHAAMVTDIAVLTPKSQRGE
jgi:biopolymer transport protein TolR